VVPEKKSRGCDPQSAQSRNANPGSFPKKKARQPFFDALPEEHYRAA